MKNMVTVTAVLAALIAAPANAQWSIESLPDEFGDPTDEKFAFSGFASPSVPLGFPYNDVEAAIIVRCSSGDPIVGIHVSRLNMRGRSILIQFDKGEKVKYSAVSWDDSIYIFGAELLAGMLAKKNSVRIAIPWAQDGHAVFEWSLVGSRKLEGLCP